MLVALSCCVAVSPPAVSYLRGHHFKIIRTSGASHSARQCADALGAPLEAVVKSVVFVPRAEPQPPSARNYRSDVSGASPRGVVVLAQGEATVSQSALSRHLGGRWRLATPLEALELTGHEVGVIPPFCSLPTLADELILGQESVFCGAGERNVHVKLAPSDLILAVGATVGPFSTFAEAARRAAERGQNIRGERWADVRTGSWTAVSESLDSELQQVSGGWLLRSVHDLAVEELEQELEGAAARWRENSGQAIKQKAAARAAADDGSRRGPDTRQAALTKADVVSPRSETTRSGEVDASGGVLGVDMVVHRGGDERVLREDVKALVPLRPEVRASMHSVLVDAVRFDRVRVVRVRRQARRLTFATIEPLTPPLVLTLIGEETETMPESPNGRHAVEDSMLHVEAAMPGALEEEGRTNSASNTSIPLGALLRSPKIVWQMIAGRTLVEERGDDVAAEILRALRPGVLLRVEGRVQLNPRGRAGLDLVVRSLDVLQAESVEGGGDATGARAQGRADTGATRTRLELNDPAGSCSGSTKAEVERPSSSILMIEKSRVNGVSSTGGGAQALVPRDISSRFIGESVTPCLGASSPTRNPPPAAPIAYNVASLSAVQQALLASKSAAGKMSDGYPFLKLNVPISLIQDAQGLDELAAALMALEREDGARLGIDLEWRPRSLYSNDSAMAFGSLGPNDFGAGPDAPTLMQLATPSRVFLVDFLAVCAYGREEHAAKLFSTLARLLQAQHVTKLGFAMRGDLQQLEKVNGLHGVAKDAVSMRDLQREAAIQLGLSTKRPPGLKALTATLLGATLDKSQQLSDWAARPFTEDQLLYAATDAWVLLLLAQALDKLQPPVLSTPRWSSGSPRPADSQQAIESLTRHSNGAAVSSASASQSWRGRQPKQARVSNGALSNALTLASQMDRLSAAIGKIPPECLLDGDLAPLGSRQAAMQMCAGLDTVKVQSCGNGGVVRWNDGYVLMLNTANGGSGSGQYRNDFWRETDGSMYFTWFPSRGQSLAHKSCKLLLFGEVERPDSPGDGDPLSSKRLLFARRRNTAPFFYCGRLEVAAIVPEGDPQEGSAREVARLWGVPTWKAEMVHATSSAPPKGAHVVWKLTDGVALLQAAQAADSLFGCGMGGGVWPLIGEHRPAWYTEEAP